MLKLRKAVSRVGTDIREFRWMAVLVVVYYLVSDRLFGGFCPQLWFTGIPCAGCGLTRAALYLLQGQMGQAAEMNPSVFPMLAFLLYCGYFRYWKGEKIRGFGAALALLVICMLAVYGCRMYLYFPERPPYIYFEDNVLEGWHPGYGNWVLEKWHEITAAA